jgi:RHS repeat-associated protein
VTYTTTGGCPQAMTVKMATATVGATIFYTMDGTTPTHNAGTPMGTTKIYSTGISVASGGFKTFIAIAYKSGMTDSSPTEFDADNSCGGNAAINGGVTGQAALAPHCVTYTLDNAGNRTNVLDNGVNTAYTTNPINQYTGVGALNNVGNGSEHEIATFQNSAYSYINDTHLWQIVNGANTYQLAYDALGRCVKRTLNSAITYYIYDGEKPILEYNSAGAIVGRNLYGSAIDEVLMRVDATYGTYYYQDDHEGSITHLTSATGTVLENYRYDAFGLPTTNGVAGAPSAKNNRFLFTGREYMGTFGVYEYRNRAYHPGLGRFMSEDPKGWDAKDHNFFRYCMNDPEDSTDPMGLDNTIDNPQWQQERRTVQDDPTFKRIDFQKADFGQMKATANKQEPKEKAPKLDQDRVNRAVDESKKAEQESDPTSSHSIFRMKDGRELDVAGRQMPNHQMKEVAPPGAPLMRDVDVNGPKKGSGLTIDTERGWPNYSWSDPFARCLTN